MFHDSSLSAKGCGDLYSSFIAQLAGIAGSKAFGRIANGLFRDTPPRTCARPKPLADRWSRLTP